MKLLLKVSVFVLNRSLHLRCKIFSLGNTVSFGNGSFLCENSFGLYRDDCSRTSHPDIPELCTTFSLADFNVEQQQVYIEVNIPNHVPIQEPFQINYRIHNRSNIVHEYKINLEQINLFIAVAGSTVVNKIPWTHSKISMWIIFFCSVDVITRSTT